MTTDTNAIARREEAGGRARAPFPVTLICSWCEHPFVAVVWYATQRRAYCSDMCRDVARNDQRRPLADRFWPKVNKDGPIPEFRPDLGPCWLWTGSKTRGYGAIYGGSQTEAGRNLPIAAHRIAYELCVAPIADGLTIDHLCRVPACVNPLHLEAVTQAENILRSEGMSARNARATHCQRGHLKTEATTYRYPDGRTECAPCRRLRWAAFSSTRSRS